MTYRNVQVTLNRSKTLKYMKLIGLTGGIGSGKSLVSSVFYKLGIPIYNADYEAKKLSNSDCIIKNELTKLFGKSIYTNKNEINKKLLSSIIFNDKDALNKVNSIIHPIVRQHFINWTNNYKNKKYIIKEAAIMFESGAYKDMDSIITISAPIDIRIKRVIKRDNVERKQVENRIKNQMNEEERIKKSDYIIYNDEKKLLLAQILKIHNKLYNL